MNDICTPTRAYSRRAGPLVLAVSLAAAGLVSGCTPAAASGRAQAAVPPGTRIPALVSCKSPVAWLKLTSLIVTISSPSAHQVSVCYTGSGTRTVAVPQVEQVTVRAGHIARLDLYQNGRVLHVRVAGGKAAALSCPR